MKTLIASMFLSLTLLGSAVAYAGDAKPLAVCRDGKTMSSTTGDHRGACSGHGGVDKWLDGSKAKGRKGTTEYK